MGQTIQHTLPVPFGGINVVDAIDRMQEVFARDLVNLEPLGEKLSLRKGYSESWDTETAAPIQSLMPLNLANGTYQLVAASDNALWIQDGATATDITGSTTPTSDIWYHAVFNHKLYMCNGVDTPQVYDGSSVSDASFTGGTTPTLSTLCFVSSYKERLFFLQNNKLTAWHTGAVKETGSADLVEFPLDFVCKNGGYSIACGSWTNNIGDQSRDLWWHISSEGEVVLYTGLDPATDFSLVARYETGRPLGRRAIVHVENDIWFITDRGIVSLASLLQGGSSLALEDISRNINPIIQSAAISFPSSYLWSAVFYRRKNQVWITVPISASNTKRLAIYLNNPAKAWSSHRFKEQGASNVLASSEGNIYAGGLTGKVYQCDQGLSDNGRPISLLIKFAWNFFNSRDAYKVFRDIRPILAVGQGSLTLKVAIDCNFVEGSSYGTIATPVDSDGASSEWDVAEWDTSSWGNENIVLFNRYGLRGQGHCGALRIAGDVVNSSLDFYSFEIRFETGGGQV